MTLFTLLATILPFRRAKKDDCISRVEAIYREYGYILKRRCRRILRDESKVEDAMQEVYLALCRSLEQYRGDPENILAWLYRITTTHSLRLLDKDRKWLHRFIEEAEEQGIPKPSLSSSHDMDAQLSLEAYLDQLETEEREAVLYRYVSGMTQEEIAEVMEVTRDQVRRWLKHFQQRGRIVLRELNQ